MKSNLLSKKMLITLVFGLASGLPLALVFGTLSLWLKDYGVAYRTIGAFSLIRLPYSFKWVWAPMVEKFNLPFIYKIGKRKSWAIFALVGLMLSIIGMSFFEPNSGLMYMAIFAIMISLFSATLDIVLDAFRVEIFDENTKDEVNGASVYVLGYRLGMVISSAGAIGLASVISWGSVYFLVSLILILGIIAVCVADEPKIEVKEVSENIFKSAIVEPFSKFVKKQYWLCALLLVFFYRLSDSYFGPLAYPFYDDLGFSKIEIAYVSKLYGMVATIVGGVLGGIIINKINMLKGLVVFAILQGLTNLLYIGLYYIGHDIFSLIAVVSLENLVSGMATTAIIAFMSVLCDRGQTATQYALLSSLMGIARDVFASSSGRVLELTSWPCFFMVSAMLALPAIVASCYLYKKKPNYALKT